MMGALGSEKEEGIIPRMVGSLFDSIQNAPSNLEFTVRVSYVEIYLEKLRDLLNPVNDNLNVREGAVGSSGARSVWIEGVTEMYVGSVAEILRLIEAGASSRAIAATRMNLESSRSHSVFIITLNKTDTETGVKTTSTLFLVDLAGSEKVEKTGAQGQTMKEAQHINKSLSALGNVINALTTGAPHVPYRDSKLTRLLSDALGGNAKTCLIITGSAQSYNAEETLSTMRFGQRAKKIQNKAVVNQELTVAQYKVRSIEISSLLALKLILVVSSGSVGTKRTTERSDSRGLRRAGSTAARG
jgi:kinesin family protein 5